MNQRAGGSEAGGPVATASATAEGRPELLVAGAFVGGLAVAFLLKQVTGG